MLALAPGASVRTYDPDAPTRGVIAAVSMHALPYAGAWRGGDGGGAGLVGGKGGGGGDLGGFGGFGG